MAIERLSRTAQGTIRYALKTPEDPVPRWHDARDTAALYRSARMTDNATPQVLYSGWTARRFIHRGPFIRPIRNYGN